MWIVRISNRLQIARQPPPLSASSLSVVRVLAELTTRLEALTLFVVSLAPG